MPEHWLPIREVRYSKRFHKSYARLPAEIQQRARKQDRLFCANPTHPSLRTHRLKGKFSAFHSYSVTRNHRVVFKRDDVHTVSYIDIGTHAVYQ